jgi:hypothetical protein
VALVGFVMKGRRPVQRDSVTSGRPPIILLVFNFVFFVALVGFVMKGRQPVQRDL